MILRLNCKEGYHGFISGSYAFDGEIRSAIEAAISKKIIASLEQLDNYLQALPRNLPIDDVSAIDVTIVEDPQVNPTFLSVGLKGEFTSLVKPMYFTFPDHGLEPRLFCSDSTKLVTIALMDYVINSTTAVYYEVHALQTLTFQVLTFILAITVEIFKNGIPPGVLGIWRYMYLGGSLICMSIAYLSHTCVKLTHIDPCAARDLLSLVLAFFPMCPKDKGDV